MKEWWRMYWKGVWYRPSHYLFLLHRFCWNMDCKEILVKASHAFFYAFQSVVRLEDKVMKRK